MSFSKGSSEKCVNVDLVSSTMNFIEQFVYSVVSYSSRYNCVDSILYSPENLIGKPDNFPNAGDYPFSYMLKWYGRWWLERESFQPHYMIQDRDPIESWDFVIVSFECPVLVDTVSIYETYNPGAVVKIWGRSTSMWHLLWKGPPQKCTERVRKFSPPIRHVTELINKIRIEFNQRELSYHTSIDAILLTGYKPRTLIQQNMFDTGIMNWVLCKQPLECVCEGRYSKKTNDSRNCFLTLPNEIILHILQYLDLQSLFRCAQVNKRWRDLTQDAVLYRELSLKRYWSKVNDDILYLFMNKCNNIRKLDLSWCGDDCTIDTDVFVEFLEKSCKNLTHLSLCHCLFLTRAALRQIGKCLDIEDLRLRRCNCLAEDYMALTSLRKITSLDISYTRIQDEQIIQILKNNPHLKHLIIDYCWFTSLDDIATAVARYNRELVTWSSWQSKTLSSIGIERIAFCHRLHELDVGWCLNLSEPANCLERIAAGCSDLRRLILSGWRGISDHLLLPVIRSCKNLTQLDLLGIKNISGDICEIALASLPKLRLLDISFCDLIRRDQVSKWREEYPNVVIQRSCDTNVM